MKQLNNTILTLKQYYQTEQNTTKADSLKTAINLCRKLLNNNEYYYMPLTEKGHLNMGYIAEALAFEYLKKTNQVQRHKNSVEAYDLEMNGEKIEVKSVILNNSAKVQHTNKIIVLLLQGKKQGFYKIDDPEILEIWGNEKTGTHPRLNRAMVEKYGTREISVVELLGE